MFSSVYSKVGDVDEAEEICQELFLRFYQRMDEVANPRGWLYGALRLVVLEYYRKKGRRDEEIDPLCDELSLPCVDGDSDTALLIREALASEGVFLSDLDRSLFELIAVYEYSCADAARNLGISYRQARYGYECVSKRIVSYLRGKGISNLEEML
jgi:DNA-directed RNA polymerase specialized sigma24 family protein